MTETMNQIERDEALGWSYHTVSIITRDGSYTEDGEYREVYVYMILAEAPDGQRLRYGKGEKSQDAINTVLEALMDEKSLNVVNWHSYSCAYGSKAYQGETVANSDFEVRCALSDEAIAQEVTNYIDAVNSEVEASRVLENSYGGHV